MNTRLTLKLIIMLASLFQLSAAQPRPEATPFDKKLINASISANGRLIIRPSKGSSANDFDFFPGNWNVANKKLKTRLNNCKEWVEFNARNNVTKILNGIGNTDRFSAKFNGADFEGMTLRLFDPKTRLWSIYWADSNSGKLD